MNPALPHAAAAPAGLRMLALAAGAVSLFSSDASADLQSFVTSRHARGGGFQGRTEAGDLYYTSFGLALNRLLGLDALDTDRTWLRDFGSGEHLDLVHRAALIRSLALADAMPDPGPWRTGLAPFRRPDGSWSMSPDGPSGGPYAAFLALLAMEDLGGADGLDRTATTVLGCRDSSGGFGSAPGAPPSTTVTAAASTVLCTAGIQPPVGTLDWLAARRDPSGGWRGSFNAALPDLLSTSVALAAIRIAGHPVPDPIEPDVEFIERHARDNGGFAGHPADPVADVEYTWYALLALGAIFAP